MIGDGPDDVLLCLTDLYQFFNNAFDNGGQWYLPNGSAVSLDLNSDIYMTRGLGVARLHRKNNALMPIGRFQCEIFDSNKISQSIYVRVFHNMPTSSSPAVTVGAGVSGAVIGGAAAGGTLLIIAIATGIVLATLAIKR